MTEEQPTMSVRIISSTCESSDLLDNEDEQTLLEAATVGHLLRESKSGTEYGQIDAHAWVREYTDPIDEVTRWAVSDEDDATRHVIDADTREAAEAAYCGTVRERAAQVSAMDAPYWHESDVEGVRFGAIAVTLEQEVDEEWGEGDTLEAVLNTEAPTLDEYAAKEAREAADLAELRNEIARPGTPQVTRVRVTVTSQDPTQVSPVVTVLEVETSERQAA